MGELDANPVERVERFAGRRAAVAAMAAWAAAEAIVLPIVPDVGLCLLVLAAPLRGPRLFAAVAIGAVAGTLVLALLATQSPAVARTLLLSVPAIDVAVLDGADGSLARNGVAGFAQLGPGTPLKVYTIEWLRQGGDIAGLVVGAVANRLTRIGPPTIVAALVGYLAGPWLRRHARLTVGAYAGLWLVFYAAYVIAAG
jgi:hypothetical protein